VAGRDADFWFPNTTYAWGIGAAGSISAFMTTDFKSRRAAGDSSVFTVTPPLPKGLTFNQGAFAHASLDAAVLTCNRACPRPRSAVDSVTITGTPTELQAPTFYAVHLPCS
jgi:hypothetical protein